MDQRDNSRRVCVSAPSGVATTLNPTPLVLPNQYSRPGHDDAAGNVAYRLALNTLMAGQHVVVLDAPAVAAELADADAVRALATAVKEGRAERARALAAALLERSIP